MKEDRIEQLMQSYGESLGASTKRTIRRPTRRRSRVLVPIAAGVLVAMAAFAMWPRDAVAAAVKRMGLAIKNARTMEKTSSMRVGNRAMKVFSHSYYQSGMWRLTTRQGTPLEATYIIRNGQALTDYTRLDHATIKKMNAPYFDMAEDQELSALDYAMDAIDSGQVSIKRKVTIEPHASVNGRSTYAVVMVRAEDDYRAEIVVDKGTDLPLFSTADVTYHEDERVHIREDFEFNQSLPESTFWLQSPKPVVNLRDAQKALTDQWSRPLAKVRELEIRDAQVTKDGTIWIATSRPEDSKSRVFPTRILDGDYVRILDINPSAILGESHPYMFKGQEVTIFGFVPLNPRQPLPKTVTLGFDQRTLNYPGFAKDDSPETPTDDTLTLDLTPSQKADRPDYFTALDLDHFGFQLPIIVWNARAEGLRNAHRLLDAAKAYERAAFEYQGFVRYAGYQPLEKAAKCYRELGMNQDADRVAAEAKDLKERRER